MKSQRQVARSKTRANYRVDYGAPRRKRHWRRYTKPIFYLLVVLGLVYLLFGSGLFDIHHIKVVGAKTVPAQSVSDSLNKILDSSLFGRNTILLSTDKLSKQLMDQDKQLGQVKIGRDFINGLVVTITEETPSLGWQSGSSVFVLSSDGRAIALADKADGTMPIVVDSANIPVKIGQKVVPIEFINFVQIIVKGLHAQKIDFLQLSVPPESIGELYVQTKTGYKIKFDTSRDGAGQLSDLKAVLSSLSTQKKLPTEYIDLRIEGRAFYK